jgi:UDP-N-acetylmuramoyl-L-alanyl-D-glutamate--2,6-diaminopimelate ligase
LYQILAKNGIKTGLIGTEGIIIDGECHENKLTTPDPFEFYEVAKRMESCGTEVIVAEVSAHAIHLEKLFGLQAEIAVFTNFSQDHLDYFGNLEQYKKAKIAYFQPHYAKNIVVNADDDTGLYILHNTTMPAISYGINNPADVFGVKIIATPDGSDFFVNSLDEVEQIRFKLCGIFNIYNALAAISAAHILGVDLKKCARVIHEIDEIEGRFNIVGSDKADFIVDYAHTPDGMLKILETARDMCKGRLIVVFGCGGNRDAEKRRVMGNLAARHADFTILTNDNPRNEDENEILREIASGFNNNTSIYEKISDRVEAIKKAYEMSEKGDIVCVLGKGAENYFEVKGERIAYETDKEIIKKLIIDNG